MVNLKILSNPLQIGEWIANIIATEINNFKPTESKPFYVLGLPTGSSPLPTYRKLIELHNQKKVSFKNVLTFNMDEYLGLPPSHTQSYHYFMFENFFNHIDIPRDHIHILSGICENPQKECEEYEKKIEKNGPIDFFLCGIGSDGHLAFNEPGSSLSSKTRVVHLCPQTISDNSRFFQSESEVPKSAVSVGIKTVLNAKKVFVIATGRSKALAVQQAIEGSVSTQWPVTALQWHEDTTVVVDESATDELKVKTVKYWKSLEN